MNQKQLLIVLLVLAILGGGTGVASFTKRMKSDSLENDKTQIAASNTLYYQNTGTLACYNEDISASENMQLTNVYNGLVELYGDADYVKETFKEVNINTLTSNRYLSSVYNKDKKFVTSVDSLDIVLTEDDFLNDRDLGWVLESTQTPSIDLPQLVEGNWELIDMNVKQIRHNQNGIVVCGEGINTKENVFFYTEGNVPGTINKNTQLSINELDTVNYFNDTSLSGFITVNNWTMRRR